MNFVTLGENDSNCHQKDITAVTLTKKWTVMKNNLKYLDHNFVTVDTVMVITTVHSDKTQIVTGKLTLCYH